VSTVDDVHRLLSRSVKEPSTELTLLRGKRQLAVTVDWAKHDRK
jgi:hypothetical protein